MSAPHLPPPRDETPPRPRRDDDFEAPESESLRKLVRHVIDEMPLRVVVAIFIVGVMFFHGMTNSLLKLAGRELASFEQPVGLIAGLVGSTALTLAILRVKYRREK